MHNTLIHADCLAALGGLPDSAVNLIYLDPPFNTNTRRVSANASYADAFGSPQRYIAFLRPRVDAMWRVLAPNGSLFFHCDWRMSHHVRLMLDDVFLGAAGQVDDGRFVNEIIWRYGLGASKARRHLLTKHDVIFWYAKSAGYVFNLLRAPPTPAMLNKYRHVDGEGRRFMRSYGKTYVLQGGKPLDDVWDIPSISPTAGERVGYPTQKPLALLRRVVQLASREGDLVLDPFCGSGTTLVAAQELSRAWLGIDQSAQAIEITRRRLEPTA